MSKGLKIVVICSLALNVLMIGIFIGHFSHRISDEGFLRRPWHENMSELSVEKQELFSKTMERARESNRDVHRLIRETRRTALAILTAPDFDEQAYRIEMEKLHDLRGKMMRNLADTTTELARQLNQDERKVLARRLERPFRSPHDDRPGNRGDDRPRHPMP